MKIVFVSDTHGDEDSLEKIVSYAKNYDAIIHTGDVLSYGCTHSCFMSEYIKTIDNIYFVRGNGDFFDGMSLMNKPIDSLDRIFAFGKLKIYATHGFVHTISSYEDKAIKEGCHILVHGHTHIKKLEKKPNLIVLNPGSPSRPRDNISSFAILENDMLRLYRLDNYEVLEEMRIDY